jgi:hypothetical protein
VNAKQLHIGRLGTDYGPLVEAGPKIVQRIALTDGNTALHIP